MTARFTAVPSSSPPRRGGASARVFAAMLAFSMALAPFAEAKRYGGGGGRSFSSRSFGGAKPSGGYSSGKSGYSSGGSAAGSSSSRDGYDSAAARAKQQADSQKRFSATKPPPIPAGASSPQGTATPPPIPGGSQRYDYGRNQGGNQPYRRGYSTGAKAAMIGAAVLAPALLVYASRPAVHYQDSYGSPFWWWLLDQPQDVRAQWLYHHQTAMDPARRAELLKADPSLQASVDALAAKNTPVDPAYAPPGLKADDMFKEPETQSSSGAPSGDGGSSGLFWITLLGGGAATGWLVFGKRWKPAVAA